MDTLTPTALAEATGMSLPFASQVLSGKRNPSRARAISIFRQTGHKLGFLAGASDDDIEVFARIEAARRSDAKAA